MQPLRHRRVRHRRLQRAQAVESHGRPAGRLSRSTRSLRSRYVLLQRADSLTRPECRLAVVGPTATGKSALALALAEAFGGEIVACDSTAVYRGIDIGTGQAAGRTSSGASRIIWSMSPIPARSIPPRRYAADAAAAIRAIHARGKLPILAGGTGLYYRALVRGLFPGPERDDVAARASRTGGGPARRGRAASVAGARRCRVGASGSFRRSQADDPRARSVSADRPRR